jgi:hypothetical protein
MSGQAILRAVVITLVCLGVCACIPWRGPDDVARLIERETGERYDRETGLTLGRCGLSLARWVVDDEDVPLDGIHKIEIGVYTRKHTGGTGTLEASSFPNWSPLVEVRSEDGERVLLLSAPRDGEIRRLLIVVEDDQELTVVRLKGRLERTLTEALTMAFDEVDRPELTEPTLAELQRKAGDS